MHVKLLFAISLLSACTATYGVGSTTSGPPPRRTSSAPPPPRQQPVVVADYGPSEDRHWLTADDYLVTNEKTYDGSTQMYVAKLMEPGSEATKNESRFLMFNGKELWTAMAFRSRPADGSELVVGAKAFCHFPSTFRSGAVGPRDKQDARTQSWVYAAITDTSAMYKGKVSIGRFLCPVGAVRVVK